MHRSLRWKGLVRTVEGDRVPRVLFLGEFWVKNILSTLKCTFCGLSTVCLQHDFSIMDGPGRWTHLFVAVFKGFFTCTTLPATHQGWVSQTHLSKVVCL